MDLLLYRRHGTGCKHASKGRAHTNCTCPIWIDGKLSGKRYHKTAGTRDWSRAENKLRHIVGTEPTPAAEGGPAPATLSVRSAIIAYLGDCEKRGLRPNSLKAYRTTLATLPGANLDGDQLALVSPALASLTPASLVAWRANRGISNGSQIKELTQIKSFFLFAMHMEWLDKNPARVLKAPKSDAEGAVPFTREQVTTILGAVKGTRLEPVIKVMLSTGFRMGDACSLRRDALNGNYITIKVIKTRRPLTIQISDKLADELRALPNAGPRFFWNSEGSLNTFMSNFARDLRRVFKTLGIEGHPHMFRDTFAARMLEAGKNIRNVSLMLGHKSIVTTEKHYAKFIPSQQKMLDDTVAGVDFLG